MLSLKIIFIKENFNASNHAEKTNLCVSKIDDFDRPKNTDQGIRK